MIQQRAGDVCGVKRVRETGRAKREDHYASRFTSHVSRNVVPLVLIVLELFQDEAGHDDSKEEIL